MRAARGTTAALAAAVVLVLGPAAAGAAEEDGVEIGVTIPGQDDGPFSVSNAEFRWGLNAETGSGAFFGGCNFLSAGESGDAGGAIVWPDDRFFSTTSGAVTIERPRVTSGGATEYRPLSWGDRCKDPQGNTVSTSDFRSTGVQAVIEKGEGRIDPGAGTAEISWDGAFTVVFYGGMTYWWVSDPVLSVEDGTGTVTATAGGYGASMEDLTKWVPLPEREIVLAELSEVDLSSGVGFSTVPDYLGESVRVPEDSAPQRTDKPEWGSFPQTFIDFQGETGQAGYWYSSGGLRDPAKPTSRLYISYDADAPVKVEDPEAPPAQAPLDPPGGLLPPAALPPGSAGPGTGVGLVPGIGTAGILPGALPGGTGLPPAGFTALPAAGAVGPQQVPPNVVATESEQAVLAAAAKLEAIYPDGSGLIPAVEDLFADPRQRLAWALSVVFTLAGTTFVGLRRGWLVLPWRSTPCP